MAGEKEREIVSEDQSRRSLLLLPLPWHFGGGRGWSQVDNAQERQVGCEPHLTLGWARAVSLTMTYPWFLLCFPLPCEAPRLRCTYIYAHNAYRLLLPYRYTPACTVTEHVSNACTHAR